MYIADCRERGAANPASAPDCPASPSAGEMQQTLAVKHQRDSIKEAL